MPEGMEQQAWQQTTQTEVLGRQAAQQHFQFLQQLEELAEGAEQIQRVAQVGLLEQIE